MQVFIVLVEIDLGDHVVSVHSTQEKADEGLAKAAEAHKARHGFEGQFHIEECTVDPE